MARGTVKFFNTDKGFGFISPQDGGADVFLHVRVVERAGIDGVDEGDEVEFDVMTDPRSGRPAVDRLQIIGKGAGSSSRGGFQPRSFDPSARPSNRSFGDMVGSGRGVVKWFNATKGFGFIQPDDGGPDVFVHITALERSGLRELPDGAAVSYNLESDRRSGKVSAVDLQLGG